MTPMAVTSPTGNGDEGGQHLISEMIPSEEVEEDRRHCHKGLSAGWEGNSERSFSV